MEAHQFRRERDSFSVPVDSNGKATVFRPFSISSPHMLAFHLAWFSLFSCFFSTFSIPPLLPLIRSDLHLSPADVGAAGIASFAGAILSRFAMGPACDLFGPRVASATLSIFTAPAILAASLVSSAGGFIIIRFLIGFSLANFVSNQFWMSSMFSGQVVGQANAVSAGWANAGSGIAQLVMPLIYSSLCTVLNSSPTMAWRLSFIFPALFQALTAVLVLAFGQDRPHSYFNTQLGKPDSSPSSKDTKFLPVLLHGLKNYRGWILGLTYGYCFGVELTTNNILAQYFYDRFGLSLHTAGLIAAFFGAGNIVSRPAGGALSDRLGRRFGMRGRLWGLWAVQTAAGLLCFLLGRVSSLWGSIVVMCCFSLFVQAASGLTFGVVPFVSKRYIFLPLHTILGESNLEHYPKNRHARLLPYR